MKIEGKKVLITGATSGIGKEIAKSLDRLGADLTIMSRRLESKDDGRLITDIVKCEFRKYDFSELENLNVSLSDAVKGLGDMDILINNVGYFKLDYPFHEYDFYEIMEHLNTNFISHIYLTNLLIRPAEQKPELIIFTSSVAGAITGSHGDTLYGAEKAGLVGFMRSLAIEYSPWLRVVAICPGFINTKLVEEPLPQDILDNAIPLKRVGKPEEVASLVIEVIRNDFINGAILPIDGGESCV